MTEISEATSHHTKWHAEAEDADVQEPTTSVQRAYEDLTYRIVTGQLPQGSRLPEQKLADELQISRIPLREALSRLAADGFTELRPRRSSVVYTWTTQAVHHLFDSRLALEPAAAARAASNAERGADLIDLEAALEASQEHMHSGDDLAFAHANVRFHQALFAAADNPIMDGLMASISGRILWLFHLTSTRDHVVACQEHRTIYRAVKNGNPRLAETLTYAHIESGRKPTFDVLQTLISGTSN